MAETSTRSYDSLGIDSLTNTEASLATPIFAPPSGNRSLEPTGNINIKVSAADTGGAVAVLEVHTNQDFITPLHVHHVENEWFYAIEGEYEIKVGDEAYCLKPGASVYAPKLMPHAIQDISGKGGKLIVVAQPAGHLEAFSVDLFKLVSSGMRGRGDHQGPVSKTQYGCRRTAISQASPDDHALICLKSLLKRVRTTKLISYSKA